MFKDGAESVVYPLGYVSSLDLGAANYRPHLSKVSYGIQFPVVWNADVICGLPWASQL